MKTTVDKTVVRHSRRGEISSDSRRESDIVSSSKVGGATVVRSTKSGKNGTFLTVAVIASDRKKLIRETSRQVRAIVSTPITAQQRERAIQLAKKAKEAQESNVTAKFKKAAA